MILTKKILDRIIVDTVSEMNELGEYKERGNGRKYIEYERQVYVLDTYIIIVCRLCKTLIKQGDYSISRIGNHLRTYDWNYYSMASKALSSEEVRELLGKKKSTPAWELLSYQSYWLQKAGNHVADMLDGEEERYIRGLEDKK